MIPNNTLRASIDSLSAFIFLRKLITISLRSLLFSNYRLKFQSLQFRSEKRHLVHRLKMSPGDNVCYGVFTPEQDDDKTNVEPVHSYDAFHTRYVGPGVKGIIGMHRFNICLVVVNLTGLNKLQLYVLALKMALDADTA